jgi:hypothetical protein
MTRLGNERGTALVITLLATMLLSALGVALVLTTLTETMITANYRTAQEALYAADAGLERSVQDLLRESNWAGVFSGNIKSGFTDGGGATLPDGTPANLAAFTSALQTQADAVYGNDPNRPVWRLYAHAALSNLVPGGAIDSNSYVIVWVADDPGETDGDPTKDSNGIAFLHAEGFGEGSARKIVEATVFKSSSVAPESGYVGQRGQDEQNRRGRTAAVQTTGKALTETNFSLATGS